MSDWKPTACILCSCNCGLEVELGGDDGRRFVRVRGDKAHPGSRGYVCQKAGRLDHYQNSRDRLTTPLRRRGDGTFEEIDWETAITEVAAKLSAIRDVHGGESIFYFGGGGQGNHLPAGYSTSTRRALGVRYRSNALAQEKTGEFWVAEEMFGAHSVGDFANAEVAVFLGKNPWQSHGFARARVVLKEIQKDPKRSMIVIDPCRTETAEMADIHLRPKPGTDAWLLVAMLGVLVAEDLVAHDWIAEHVSGLDQVLPMLREVPVETYCEACGVGPDEVRRAVRRLAAAESVSVFEDLGVQMNRHSTLTSYLNRLLWVLTGNFGRSGCHNVASAMRSLTGGGGKSRKTSPVVGAPILAGLVPCNVIAEEILTDHPRRYRAMIVESANPAHSLADSQKMRAALAALDCVVVIDVALTETARLADYVLPTPTQYEKAEATFFNFDFPANTFQLRHPLLTPPEGVLPEAEIHARLVEALGLMPDDVVAELRQALASGGRAAFGRAFAAAGQKDARMTWLAPVVLYRTLGETLPEGLGSAAALWPVAHMCAASYGDSVRRAGIVGDGPALGEALFDAILENRSGLVFTVDEPEVSWQRVGTPDGRIQAAVPELFDDLRSLRNGAARDDADAFPLLLAAGERRSFTANTIYRDPEWRKKDAEGTLRVHPEDLARCGLTDGDLARLTTKRGSVEVPVEASERMLPGQIALPNGLGLDYPDPAGKRERTGIAPNELTALEDRDGFAGTPWHKIVPARLEPVT